MIENAHVEVASFIWLIVGTVFWIAVPVAIAIIWKLKKKEPITSILVGAATFLLFALILEKPIQNVLAFPTAMGLPEHTVSRFLNANPVLLALVAGLFPGVFEETGRLIAFKTVLRKRKNKETSISYGIGHGGFEAILAVSFCNNSSYRNGFYRSFEHLQRDKPFCVDTGGNSRSIRIAYILRCILAIV